VYKRQERSGSIRSLSRVDLISAGSAKPGPR
jgi:hypothetical protein